MGEDGSKGDMGEKVSKQTGSFCLLHHLCSEREIHADATMTFAVYALAGWLRLVTAYQQYESTSRKTSSGECR